MNDPWSENTRDPENTRNLNLQFEDNFITEINLFHPIEEENKFSLPDTNYLRNLENKLKKIKNNPKILEELHKKREAALQNLLNDCNFNSYNDENLELDTPIGSGNSDKVQEIRRHICPIQPLNIGEIVHIVKYDQLEEDKSENEELSETPSR